MGAPPACRGCGTTGVKTVGTRPYREPETELDPGWTYEDLLACPEEWGVEIVDGWMVRERTPGLAHREVVGRLYAALLRHLGDAAFASVFLAPVAVILTPDTVLQPDLCYVAPDRRRAWEDAIHGPPDLAVEVVSSTRRDRDLIIKRWIYARYGVPEFWAVDLARERVFAFRQPGPHGYARAEVAQRGDVLASEVLAGFAVEVAELLPGGPWREVGSGRA